MNYNKFLYFSFFILYFKLREYLKTCGVENSQVITINFEDMSYEYLLDYKALHTYVTERLVPDKMTYIFLDEIQIVPNFQKVVDSLFIKENVDIYITGSNAHMLSGELATLLSGRYIEIQMLPLSFSEYYELVDGDHRTAWNAYFRNGGFPYSAQIEEEDIRTDYLSGIYNTVLLKDIVARKKVQDVPLLESVIKFLFDNIGNILENIVYLELIRKGYSVSVGKIGDLEVDFIAESKGDKIYYQVCASVLDPTTFARELAPLKKIPDHYPKFIISMDEIPMNEDGIKQINIIDFLLS